jgi:hypothetical protein
VAIAIFGLGSVGSQAARQLAGTDGLRAVDKRVSARDITYELEPGDIAILATPCGTHVDLARAAIECGAHVVSVSDATAEVEALLELDSEARAHESTVIVGAGFAPGLSCVLARHGVSKLDTIDGISVSKHGTGGPACARQHHRASKQSAYDWVDGEFITRPSASGRDLVWFPAPVGAKDCYRASLPSPILLRRMFPEAQRITSRVSGTRRDRLTARLPMLRPPHADGGLGGIRVEIRGTRDGVYSTVVFGVAAAPSAATSLVASVAAAQIVAGECIPGSRGLAEQGDPRPWLEAFRAGGIKIETFSGV